VKEKSYLAKGNRIPISKSPRKEGLKEIKDTLIFSSIDPEYGVTFFDSVRRSVDGSGSIGGSRSGNNNGSGSITGALSGRGNDSGNGTELSQGAVIAMLIDRINDGWVAVRVEAKVVMVPVADIRGHYPLSPTLTASTNSSTEMAVTKVMS
jgi:hypothetical protein